MDICWLAPPKGDPLRAIINAVKDKSRMLEKYTCAAFSRSFPWAGRKAFFISSLRIKPHPEGAWLQMDNDIGRASRDILAEGCAYGCGERLPPEDEEGRAHESDTARSAADSPSEE
jgi:hypothetical protein